MSKVRAVLKSTARDLVIGALVVVTIYLLVQMFNRPGLPPEAADPALAGACAQGADAAACPPGEPAAAALHPPADEPLYVTVTVAE